MPPLDAFENRIADALIVAFKKISSEREPETWLTTPRTIQRGFVLAGLALPRPVLLVQLAEWGDTPMMAGRHDGVANFQVHMITDLNDGDATLIRVARDLKKAIAADEILKGLVQFMRPIGYSPQVEAMDKTGFAVATMTIEVRYDWGHEAP